MLRAVLLGLLAVSATSSCSGGSDTATVAPGAVAGKVLEASGTVAATRNGATRTLAVGAEVFADDVIDTARGSVLILLQHNNARWAVESGQRTRVDESLAWKLAKQDGPAKTVDHASSAAGREGERTAADTRATTETAPAVEAAAMPESPVAAGSPAVPEPPPPPPPLRQPKAGGGGASASRGEGAKNSAKDSAKESASNEAQDEKKEEKPAQKPRAAADDAVAPEAAARPLADSRSPAVRLEGELVARRAQLQRCADARALTLVVRLAAGTPKIELTGGTAPATVRACLERVVKQISMPGLTATATIKLGK